MMTPTRRWNLWLKGDHAPCEVITRAHLREYLSDGSLTRADVRRLYRYGETEMSGTPDAEAAYLICEQDREPIYWA